MMASSERCFMRSKGSKADPAAGLDRIIDGHVMFAEEVRQPLCDDARDAFLRAMEEDREPTPAAIAAAKRYKEMVESGRIRLEGVSPTPPKQTNDAGG